MGNPLLGPLVGGIFAGYLREAQREFGRVGKDAPFPIGDFNALRVLDGKNAVIELPNLLALEKALKETSPDLFRAYKRRLRAIGNPTADAMRKTFKNIMTAGPLGPPKTGKGRARPRRYDRFATSSVARLSWHNSVVLNQRKAIDVNYKDRTSAKQLQKLKDGKDGNLGIVRVRIHAPAYIVADMAGKTGRAGKVTGQYTPYYRKINIDGKTRHKVNRENSENWVRALDGRAHQRKQGKASRYAWPTMEEHSDKFRSDTSQVLNQTIAELNRRMAA